MSAKHTPGPNVEHFEEWNRSRGYIRNFDKMGCCPPVYEHPDTQYAWEIWVASFDDSAALELLESLAHMVAVSNWATTIQSEEQYDAMITEAEAAIRKAKGDL